MKYRSSISGRVRASGSGPQVDHGDGVERVAVGGHDHPGLGPGQGGLPEQAVLAHQAPEPLEGAGRHHEGVPGDVHLGGQLLVGQGGGGRPVASDAPAEVAGRRSDGRRGVAVAVAGRAGDHHGQQQTGGQDASSPDDGGGAWRTWPDATSGGRAGASDRPAPSRSWPRLRPWSAPRPRSPVETSTPSSSTSGACSPCPTRWRWGRRWRPSGPRPRWSTWCGPTTSGCGPTPAPPAARSPRRPRGRAPGSTTWRPTSTWPASPTTGDPRAAGPSGGCSATGAGGSPWWRRPWPWTAWPTRASRMGVVSNAAGQVEAVIGNLSLCQVGPGGGVAGRGRGRLRHRGRREARSGDLRSRPGRDGRPRHRSRPHRLRRRQPPLRRGRGPGRGPGAGADGPLRPVPGRRPRPGDQPHRRRSTTSCPPTTAPSATPRTRSSPRPTDPAAGAAGEPAPATE